MPASFNALIVEGTHGVGKSTLIDALIRKHVGESPERKIRTFLHLAQSHTYGPLAHGEDAGTLTVAQNLAHLEHIVEILEWLERSVRDHQRAACFAIVDTLHLTHCVRPGRVQWRDVAPIDERLGRIGCKLLLLEGSPRTIRARGIQAAAGTQFLTEYAVKFGSTTEELCAYFVREQAIIKDLAARSSIPRMMLDADGALDDLAEAAYGYWVRPSTA
ncbi:MAG TPA: hypothetical protein VFA29_11775 [Candidatus Baltobacteraceae bacterium]|nr:hypothetical protein [Candidatus Baltobacteraceae bacterium]